MGKVNSREKGIRFERQLAAKLVGYGYGDSRRTAQYCGNTGDASDVVGLPGIHIEAKHQEQMRLREWIRQAEHDAAGTGKLPVVFHRRNREEILVTMQLDSFMALYHAYEEAQTKRKGEPDERDKKTICRKKEQGGAAV